MTDQTEDTTAEPDTDVLSGDGGRDTAHCRHCGEVIERYGSWWVHEATGAGACHPAVFDSREWEPHLLYTWHGKDEECKNPPGCLLHPA